MTERTKEYAFFSDLSYDLPPFQTRVEFGGHRFDVVARSEDPNTGFFAAAFRDTRDGHTIIAFRGTNDLPDVLVDAGMVATRLNAQAIESEVFTAKVIQKVTAHRSDDAPMDISVTGHSLGGGLAQLNAERFALKGESFNAYGTLGLVSHHREGGSQMVNHVRAGDPVSAASGHFGEVRIYATADDIRNIEQAGYGYDSGYHPGRAISAVSASAHSMSNFVDIDGQKSIINADAEALYRSHAEAIDHYRSDVRTSRELATVAIGNPAVVGVSLSTMAGVTEAALIAAQFDKLVKDAAGPAHAIEQGAAWSADVAMAAFTPAGTSEFVHGTTTGSAQLDQLVRAASIKDEGHPGHAMYREALGEISKLDAANGRSTDSLSEKLAASLAVEGRKQGLSHIDHVVLSDDATNAYAVQGDMNSPFKQIASVQTELGIGTSLEASSRAWVQANDAAVQTMQARDVQQEQVQESSVAPTMGR